MYRSIVTELLILIMPVGTLPRKSTLTWKYNVIIVVSLLKWYCLVRAQDKEGFFVDNSKIFFLILSKNIFL